ncbi:hypothetical protein C8F01DRAFT_507613 [Mycena amicta]|nr:hypothetical protein C8F01DRAFT_507613 [Mycena amicta]
MIPPSRDWTRQKSPIEKTRNPKEKAKMQDVKDSFSKSTQPSAQSAKEQFQKLGPQSSVLPSIPPFFLRRFETGDVLPTLALYANPRADSRDAITLPEITSICADGLHPDSTLELTILSTYKLDYDSLAPHFPQICLSSWPSRHLIQKRRPRLRSPVSSATTTRWAHIQQCLHTLFYIPRSISSSQRRPKLIPSRLLLYRSGRLRVVISTANLRPLDWGVLENDVILKPRGFRASDGSTAKSPFNPDEQFVHFLERILEATNVECALKDAQQTHKDLRLKTISDLSKLWDCRGVRAALVHSIPGKYRNWKTLQRCA